MIYTSPFTIAIAYRRSTEEDYELFEEACYENNEFARQRYINVGYEVYPGMTGEEARRLKAAWELEEAEQ